VRSITNSLWSQSGRYSSHGELYPDRDIWLLPEEKVILTCTLEIFDQAREYYGRPLKINSGRRSQKYQDLLTKKGYRTAKYSPHVLGAALDVDVPDDMTDVDLAKLLRDSAAALSYRVPRIGYLQYRGDQGSSSFVHFDCAWNLPSETLSKLPLNVITAYTMEGLTW